MTTSVRQSTSSNTESADNGYISSESHSNGGINPRRSLKSKIFDNLSQRPVGQFFLRSIDHWLWSLEKTIGWMPPGSQRPDGVFSPTSPTPPERPLPWILFLPALFLIRAGFILNGLFSKILSYIPITPEEVIKVIQRRRRRFRYLKYVGKRALNSNHPNGINTIDHTDEGSSLFVKVIFWPYFVAKNIFHFFGFDAEVASPPRSPVYLCNTKFNQEKKRKLSDLNEPINGTCTVVTEDSGEEGEEDEETILIVDAMQKEWVDEEPSQDPDYVPPSEEEEESEDEVPSCGEEENDEDADTLCASSEDEINKRSKELLSNGEPDASDQPESDLVLEPKTINGNLKLKEEDKSDVKGINEKNKPLQEVEGTLSSSTTDSTTDSSSKSTTPENSPPKDLLEKRSDDNNKKSTAKGAKKQKSPKNTSASQSGKKGGRMGAFLGRNK